MASDANTLQPMDAPTHTPPGGLHNLPNDILQSADTTAPSTAAAAATTPGSDAPLSEAQRALSLKVSLADLAARASHHYAQRHYEDAAAVYAQAAEMQAEMHGELSAENAEILFLYGRSLFKVGQAKSDVLGGRAPAEGAGAVAGAGVAGGAGKKGAARKKKARAKAGAGESYKEREPAADGATAERVETEGAKEGKKELDGKKPMFQFTGDENWDDSDEEEGGDVDEDEGEDDEEDDDLAIAFEILDLARVLLKKKLDEKLAAVEASEGKGKEVANGQAEDAGVRHLKERLADTHDLLAEISLENERYPNAIADARECLMYQQMLLPEDHEIIAEAHYKLSLALEFASVTEPLDEEGAAPSTGPRQINQELRDEAAKELAAAIDSTKMKLHNKEVELATLHNPEDNAISRRQIADMKDILADMEQRLVDLRDPPIDMQAVLGAESLGGLLGGLMGAQPAETEARIAEAKKNATDLTGLVRKKGKSAAPAAAPAPAEASNGKRKASNDVLMENNEASKRFRTTEQSS